jgi:rRNA maturation protein Nop10
MLVKEPLNSQQTQNTESAPFIRCKVCGFVTSAGTIKDLCPACGVKATMFEPVTEKFSVERRKFLELHIHPILVHFPQAFAITLLLTVIGSIIFSGAFKQILLHTTELLSYVMPLVLLLSFFSGIKDGEVRFKKLTAPFLALKIKLGITYFVISILNAVSASYFIHGQQILLAVVLICTLAMTILTAILGKIGAELSCSKMPG